MATQGRVRSGVPTGGQFATVDRSESGVVLHSPVATALVAREAAQRAADLTVTRQVARAITAEHPTARYLLMDVSDQGSDSMLAVAVLDGKCKPLADNGTELSEEVHDLTYELTDGGPWAEHRAYPFGKPEKRMVGRPCLDLASAAAITDDDIKGIAPEPVADDGPDRVYLMAGDYWYRQDGRQHGPHYTREAAEEHRAEYRAALSPAPPEPDVPESLTDESVYRVDRLMRDGWVEEKADPWVWTGLTDR